MTPSATLDHPVSPDTAAPAVDRDVRTPDVDDYQLRVGRAIERAVGQSGWSHKEAAAAIGVDDGEFGKWTSGARRPHIDRILRQPHLSAPLIVALAELVPEIEITTEIRVRWKAARR